MNEFSIYSRQAGFALAAILAFGACSGSDGANGKDGTNGTNGTNGTDGKDGTLAIDPNLPAMDKAVLALGGADALRGIKTLQYSASGQQFHQGQAFEPLGESRPVGTFSYTSATDVANNLLRLDYTRTVDYPFPATLTYSYILRDNLGVVVGVDNIAGVPGGAMTSARWAALRKEQILLHPELIVRYAMDNPTKVTSAGIAIVDSSLHEVVSVDVSDRFAGMGRMSVFVNHLSGVVTKISTTENDHLLRDVQVEALFGAAKPVSGVQIPEAAALSVGGELVLSESRTDIAVNPTIAADQFAFPTDVTPTFDAAEARRGSDSHQWHEQFQSIGFSLLDPLQINVMMPMAPAMLAPGVFLLSGDAVHNSLVVEQASGVVVVEAPLYPEHADAIIAWVKANIPGKPITHVIATHHHVDHAGGLRSFVAEGATVVADQRAADLYLRVFTAASTVRPDRLATSPRAPKLQLVSLDQPVHLDDAQNPIDVFHLPTQHASDMVLISLPTQHIVFNSDLFSKGFPFVKALGQELRDRISQLGLDTTSLMMPGGHGASGATLSDLDAALQAAPQ